MEKGILLLLLGMMFSNLTFAAVDDFTVRVPFCATRFAKDYIFGFRDQTCPVSGVESAHRPHFVVVTEGDERWLQIALDMIHKNKCDYVALLFYASWCPFSRSFRPSFDVISSLFSSIPHFAIKESSVKPSTLSKYGVHGFPTLLLLNSTMRARYRGTRMLDSLVAFYSDVTGIETLDKTSLERSVLVPHLENENNTEPENCPFTWARSPENMLRQETYLALAIVFVLLRLIHLLYPTLVVFMKFTWGRIAQNMRLESLLEHTVGFLSRAVQLCMHRRSNLQGGAMNARAWASKSLATVSIGDSSSSNRGSSASQ
ncbi:PREDICTED: 5'-adenylylsulfate reductase-like 4 [Camelina sativa]|uniref:5'-adenylylsulfate reductase-like 4 n=1 Tax=Camelina sativa TaxID=90675 RepID=A0ABM0VUH7_CAMSA|nr:PREDICTED: 5'-adenylylsulfate reductase-like 4 [Camelina sativa]